jgi:hypothetical protein
MKHKQEVQNAQPLTASITFTCHTQQAVETEHLKIYPNPDTVIWCHVNNKTVDSSVFWVTTQRNVA